MNQSLSWRSMLTAQAAWTSEKVGHFIEDCGIDSLKFVNVSRVPGGSLESISFRRCYVSWTPLLARGCMESGSSAGNWGSSQLFGMHFIASRSGCLPTALYNQMSPRILELLVTACWLKMIERFITPSSESLRGAKLNSLPFTGWSSRVLLTSCDSQVLLKHLGAEVRGFWLPVDVGCWDIGSLWSDRFRPFCVRGQEGKFRKHHTNHSSIINQSYEFTTN